MFLIHSIAKNVLILISYMIAWLHKLFRLYQFRSKSYCMWNEQLTKEDYLNRLAKIDLESYKSSDGIKRKI